MPGGGEHPPTNPKYDADGSGRDTYIRRDPVDCYGKMLYKPVERIPTRFGAHSSPRPAPVPHGGHTSE